MTNPIPQIHYGWIAAELEEKIISNIPVVEQKNGTGRNQIRRFGSSVPYSNHYISDSIPDYLKNIADSLHCNHVSINEYFPSQGIHQHIDSKESGESIYVLSLKGNATMKFDEYDNRENFFTVNLPPRSLLVLEGDLRYKWRHGILPVSEHRYSLVFRNG